MNNSKGEAEKIIAIQVNQTGYYTNERKTAVFTASEQFMLCKADNDETVLTGLLIEKGLDVASEDQVKTADFTECAMEGNYYLKSDIGEKSYRFCISSHLYENLKKDALKAFYYQRCGCLRCRERMAVTRMRDSGRQQNYGWQLVKRNTKWHLKVVWKKERL